MKKSKSQSGHRGRRSASQINGKLDRSLLSYATTATAAGVGVLALACPALAKVVYTPVNEQIFPNKTFPLDLNNDGKVDFTLVDSSGRTTFAGGWGFLTIFPAKSINEVWGGQTSHAFRRYASALDPGVTVGPQGKFAPGERVMAHSSVNQGRHALSSYYCAGPWKRATNRYLGLKFYIAGKIHYCWARLSVSCGNLAVNGTLTGYAYETVPNKSIITGQTHGGASAVEGNSSGSSASVTPEVTQDSFLGMSNRATLGELAMGAPALFIWRRNLDALRSENDGQ